MEIISALILGLLGSFHCAGMCGPIALALPLHQQSWLGKSGAAIVYNLGRTFTYAVLGFFFGLFGEGLAFGGMQQWVSIILGVLMITSVLFPIIFKNLPFLNKITDSFTVLIQKLFIRFLKQPGLNSLLILGMLNGLLPCGLVYMAIAGALESGSFVKGTLFMAFFGLGTIPMMFFISIIGTSLSIKLRQHINRIIPVVVILLGLIFILRGLNLGIPYISPKDKMLEPHKKTEMTHKMQEDCCHSKPSDIM